MIKKQIITQDLFKSFKTGFKYGTIGMAGFSLLIGLVMGLVMLIASLAIPPVAKGFLLIWFAIVLCLSGALFLQEIF